MKTKAIVEGTRVEELTEYVQACKLLETAMEIFLCKSIIVKGIPAARMLKLFHELPEMRSLGQAESWLIEWGVPVKEAEKLVYGQDHCCLSIEGPTAQQKRKLHKLVGKADRANIFIVTNNDVAQLSEIEQAQKILARNTNWKNIKGQL